MPRRHRQYLFVIEGETGAQDARGPDPKAALRDYDNSIEAYGSRPSDGLEYEEVRYAVYELPKDVEQDCFEELETADSDERLLLLKRILRECPIKPAFFSATFGPSGKISFVPSTDGFEFDAAT